MYTNFESGRSMVEMLGVLAVVGVLSVAGIAAYNNAMNKYRANEILNEASKRATIVAMQFASGRTTGSLAEFTNNDLGYAKFAPETAAGDNENQFKLILETPPISAVCTQMKNQVGSASAIRKIATDCSALSYNKDLSTTSYASDFNGNPQACLAQNYHYCSNNTCAPEKCCHGRGIDSSGGCNCFPGFSGENCENTICQAGQYCGPTVGCCQQDEICTTGGDIDGTCFKIETGCRVNEDCEDQAACSGNKCYCEIVATNECDDIREGRCVIKSNFEDIFIPIPYQDKTLYAGPKMNWWSARNFCWAYQMKLPTLASLGFPDKYEDKTGNGELYQIFSPYLDENPIVLWSDSRSPYAIGACAAGSLYIKPEQEFINTDRRGYSIRVLCE